MDTKREKFLRAYANVPDKLREDILVVVDDKSYTWNAAYLEIKNNTPLGKKILKNLELMGLL
jgi:UV DNA damage repair endonuclease